MAGQQLWPLRMVLTQQRVLVKTPTPRWIPSILERNSMTKSLCCETVVEWTEESARASERGFLFYLINQMDRTKRLRIEKNAKKVSRCDIPLIIFFRPWVVVVGKHPLHVNHDTLVVILGSKSFNLLALWKLDNHQMKGRTTQLLKTKSSFLFVMLLFSTSQPSRQRGQDERIPVIPVSCWKAASC